MAKDFHKQIAEVEERLGDKPLEYVLGKGLDMPMNQMNAAARRLMHSSHRDQILALINGEKAILETGYEIRFGDLSSSITAADSDYEIVAKISKFSFSPNHHYWLIMKDLRSNRLDVVERISYMHKTESYGFLYNNMYLDTLDVGRKIPNQTILQKSSLFDPYMNRADGVNFNVAYMSLDQNMEDSIIMSDVAAKKLCAPLIKPVKIMINENDIPLNLYGTSDVYKCIPDIGEDIKDAILIALRKEKKDESIYTQSVEHLKKYTMSDEKYTLTGRVIDVNICCNNIPNLEQYYNGQFKMYYNELQRSSAEIVSVVTKYLAEGYELSYELEKLYANAKRALNKDQYIDKRLFSNIILEVIVLEEMDLRAGDKASNRFGGKGVTSKVLPQEMMPKFHNDQYVDIIFNSNGVYGRLNPAQLFELSYTHIGNEILYRITNGEYSVDEALEIIIKYTKLMVKDLGDELERTINNMDSEAKRFYLESVILRGSIDLSARPISDPFNIDHLAMMYEQFPWVEKCEIEVPIKDSYGNIRYVKARQPITIGKQYIFRLKQYGEEKFSATSLSATNIRNENSKSKARREYRELYSNTPIRFGNMESNEQIHLGVGYLIQNMFIHSLSPQARRLTEQMYTGDPFDIDIRLDRDSSNRSAEITNTYLKTIGRRLTFTKIKKIRKKITIQPITFEKYPYKSPIFFNTEENFDWDKDWNDRMELQERKAKDKNIKHPIIYYGIDEKRAENYFNDLVEYEYHKWYTETARKKRKEIISEPPKKSKKSKKDKDDDDDY